MRLFKGKGMRLTIWVYWFLLAYIVAALVWWFISLEKQNKQMTGYKYGQLTSTVDSIAVPRLFDNLKSGIAAEDRMNTTKYIGEGVIFLALILVGAAFLYRSVRRQIKLQQQQQNFMMAITHELKTPIAVAKLNLETLQKHQLDTEKQQKLISNTIQEVNRLNTLASNILVSAQLEEGRNRSVKEDLDLSALVQSCANDFRHRFSSRPWSLSIDPEIDYYGDALLLQVLVNNLLENAIKYSPKQGTIGCSLQQKHNKVLLQITDEGPGIPDEEKKRIFNKFYRIGNEATRSTKGTGLGLYLCRQIAEDHHASIRVTNHTPTGCNFTVSFNL